MVVVPCFDGLDLLVYDYLYGLRTWFGLSFFLLVLYDRLLVVSLYFLEMLLGLALVCLFDMAMYNWLVHIFGNLPLYLVSYL